MLFVARANKDTIVVYADSEESAREIAEDEMVGIVTLEQITHIGQVPKEWLRECPYTADGEAAQTVEYLVAEETAWAIREASEPPVPKAEQMELFS